MQKLSTCLWFDNQAEAAMNFYLGIFKNSRKKQVNYYGDHAPMPKGTVLTANFELQGQDFVALNGGPHYKFSPATSFVVHCQTQDEVDHYWNNLVAGGQPQQCGWLTDKYGVTWQIVPDVLPELLSGPDTARAQRVMQAMMKMVKLDIKTLEQA